ncbi:hypothetical protein BD626DRAFT_627111 [Schizophyllum amplum]|uniref:Uncharacterized protein n=1 Tax=Schizophyllum amplum TaxID=97359 RepID=A0A550CP65_9AGAR|nr:hypothetical protein BD626DRAFT_627111 [Auriculariopsis ampla]
MLPKRLTDEEINEKLDGRRVQRGLKAPDPTIQQIGFIFSLAWQGYYDVSLTEIGVILEDDPGLCHWATEALKEGVYSKLREEAEKKKASELSYDSFRDEIATFLAGLRPAMHSLASGQLGLGTWTAPVDSAYAKYLQDLNIPHVKNIPTIPSLLLHKLGSFDEIDALRARVDTIFCGQHVYLCNASGSGKTRLLIEGLCKHWGLYITCCKDEHGIGSQDLQELKRKLDNPKIFHKYLCDSKDYPVRHSAELAKNRGAAKKIVSALLISRLYALRTYLDSLPPLPWKPTDEAFYRKQWLLLQLDPSIIRDFVDASIASEDVFLSLATMIYKRCPVAKMDDVLLDLVKTTMPKRNLNPRMSATTSCGPDFFVVMDEVQNITIDSLGAFESSTRSGHPRALLREIVVNVRSAFATSNVFIVPTGTNVTQAELDQALESALVKSVSQAAYRCTGGLDTFEAMCDYLSDYFPPSFRMSPSGSRLLSRSFCWLRGRYRFTAAFLVRLLRNGFKSPHRILNHYVWQQTRRYWPSDADDLAAMELELPPPVQEQVTEMSLADIHFDGLRRNDQNWQLLFNEVRSVVFDCLLRSSTKLALGEAYTPDMVRLGLARYTIEGPQAASTSQVSPSKASEVVVPPAPVTGKSLTSENPDVALLDSGELAALHQSPSASGDPPADDRSAEISEPLVLLRLASYMDGRPYDCTYHYLAQRITVKDAENNGWENYVAHCLVRLFSSEKSHKLSDIFDLRKVETTNSDGTIIQEDNHAFDELMDLEGTVVRIVRDESDAFLTTADLIDDKRPGIDAHDKNKGSYSRRPTCNTGTRADSMPEALQWLRTNPTPIFFPNNLMGPDIFFLLKLSNGEFVWVAVQCKFDTPVTASTFKCSTKIDQAAAGSVTPSLFFIPKTQPTPELALKRNQMILDRLREPPNVTKLAGEYGVLRVIACFPSIVNLEDMTDPDQDGHPLLLLKPEILKEAFGSMEPKKVLHVLERQTRNKIAKTDVERKSRAEAKELEMRIPKAADVSLPGTYQRPLQHLSGQPFNNADYAESPPVFDFEDFDTMGRRSEQRTAAYGTSPSTIRSHPYPYSMRGGDDGASVHFSTAGTLPPPSHAFTTSAGSETDYENDAYEATSTVLEGTDCGADHPLAGSNAAPPHEQRSATVPVTRPHIANRPDITHSRTTSDGYAASMAYYQRESNIPAPHPQHVDRLFDYIADSSRMGSSTGHGAAFLENINQWANGWDGDIDRGADAIQHRSSPMPTSGYKPEGLPTTRGYPQRSGPPPAHQSRHSHPPQHILQPLSSANHRLAQPTFIPAEHDTPPLLDNASAGYEASSLTSPLDATPYHNIEGGEALPIEQHESLSTLRHVPQDDYVAWGIGLPSASDEYEELDNANYGQMASDHGQQEYASGTHDPSLHCLPFQPPSHSTSSYSELPNGYRGEPLHYSAVAGATVSSSVPSTSHMNAGVDPTTERHDGSSSAAAQLLPQHDDSWSAEALGRYYSGAFDSSFAAQPSQPSFDYWSRFAEAPRQQNGALYHQSAVPGEGVSQSAPPRSHMPDYFDRNYNSATATGGYTRPSSSSAASLHQYNPPTPSRDPYSPSTLTATHSGHPLQGTYPVQPSDDPRSAETLRDHYGGTSHSSSAAQPSQPSLDGWPRSAVASEQQYGGLPQQFAVPGYGVSQSAPPTSYMPVYFDGYNNVAIAASGYTQPSSSDSYLPPNTSTNTYPHSTSTATRSGHPSQGTYHVQPYGDPQPTEAPRDHHGGASHSSSAVQPSQPTSDGPWSAEASGEHQGGASHQTAFLGNSVSQSAPSTSHMPVSFDGYHNVPTATGHHNTQISTSSASLSNSYFPPIPTANPYTPSASHATHNGHPSQGTYRARDFAQPVSHQAFTRDPGHGRLDGAPTGGPSLAPPAVGLSRERTTSDLGPRARRLVSPPKRQASKDQPDASPSVAQFPTNVQYPTAHRRMKKPRQG